MIVFVPLSSVTLRALPSKLFKHSWAMPPGDFHLSTPTPLGDLQAESGSFLLAVRDRPRQYSVGVMEDVHRTIGSLHRGGAKLQLDTTGLIAALTAVTSTFRGDP